MVMLCVWEGNHKPGGLWWKPTTVFMTRSSAGWLPRDQEWLWPRWLLIKQQSCLPLSLGSNNTVTISDTDCTDLRRDGQIELASMKQDVSQNRPWFIRGQRIVVDSTWFESVTARKTAINTEIRSSVQCQVFDSTNHYKHYCWVCRMETELQTRTSLSCQFEQNITKTPCTAST